MSSLGRPPVVASLLVGAAIALHPALGAASWLPERDLVVAALLLLAALALGARALSAPAAERLPAWLAALGALVVVGALGLDGVAGHHGSLTLGAGQARGHFEEAGPGGRALGLRPLGFSIGVDRVRADGGVDLAFSGAAATSELAADRAVAHEGFRFARPRTAPTGDVARLRVSVSDGTSTRLADVAPGRPGQAAGLEIALEQYFPDFALDDQQQPFTRSVEPRNPAALLTVRRGAETHRAFVLQAMPGVHKIEPLGVSFSLVEIEPEQRVEMAVHHEPAAPVALGGGLLLAVAVAFGALRAWRSPAAVAVVDPPLVAGAALALALVLVDRGGLLAWRVAVPTRAAALPLPGVGVLLGAALLAALLGSLLLAAQHAAGNEASVQPVGRLALWAAVAAGTLGVLVATVQVAVASDVTSATAMPVLGVGLAVGLLAAALALTSRGSDLGRGAALALPLAVALAVVAAVALAARSLGGDGTYATTASVSATSAALLGLAALEPTGLVAARRLAFVVALVLLLLRPL